MRILLPALVLAASAACGRVAAFPTERPSDACGAGSFVEGKQTLTVQVQGKARQALVWIPRTAGPHDVVVNLHEYRASPERQQHYAMWHPMVEDAGVILVAPDGKSATWNAGECCGKSVERKIDDVAFLDAVLARIDDVACTSGRVLATGIGNGGMMAEHWACESGAVDAVVSVGGSLQTPSCRRSTPIPYLHYHGDADTFFPPDGSVGRLYETNPTGHRPVRHAEAIWAARNRATAANAITSGDLTCKTWTGDAPLASCSIRGGTDTWPGSANGAVKSDHPLANATRGAWAWVEAAWGEADAQ